jgi:hypothetical protein
MQPFFAAFLPVVTLAAMTAGAAAASYPVSGTWTYDNATAEGPAKECGKRYMNFAGNQRFDTGGGVPSYRNFSVTAEGSSTFRIVDEFATGQMNARSTYTLRILDQDHIELHLPAGNHTIRLRRCGG